MVVFHTGFIGEENLQYTEITQTMGSGGMLPQENFEIYNF